MVSYRRADSGAATGRIVDRLVARYGAGAVFMDLDGIPYGVDFRQHIQSVLAGSDVLLAVIGQNWAGERGGAAPRLAEPDDPVRVEVETALRGAMPIIPVLVDGAAMPKAAALPESLAPLHYLNAATVAMGRDFHVHMDRLIAAIDALLAQKYGAAPPGPDVATPPARQRAPTVREWIVAVGPAAAVLVLPFAAQLGVMTPPWPSAAPVVTAIVSLLAIFFAYQIAAGAVDRLRRALMIGAAVVAVLAAVGYAAGVALYTYQAPKTGQLSAKGFECTRDAALVYKDQCPALGPDALAEAAYQGGYLWTAGSIGLVEAALAGLWFGGFIAVSVLAGGFAASRLAQPSSGIRVSPG